MNALAVRQYSDHSTKGNGKAQSTGLSGPLTQELPVPVVT